MSPMNNRRMVPTQEPGILDFAPGAAAAYSLRNLSLSYNSPVVTVRRSTDSAEADFTASEVSDGTLAAWCGGGDGFVKQWWDQSGSGRHCLQTTSSRQPKVVIAGVSPLFGDRPAIQFFSASDTYLSTDIDPTFVQPLNLFMAARYTALDGLNTSPRGLFGAASTSTGCSIREGDTGIDVLSITFLYSQGPVGYDTDQHIWNVLFNGANSHYTLDAVQVVAGNAGTIPPRGAQFGSDARLSGRSADCIIAEAVLYNSESRALDDRITGNQMWYY